jgi:hypothetical protein
MALVETQKLRRSDAGVNTTRTVYGKTSMHHFWRIREKTKLNLQENAIFFYLRIKLGILMPRVNFIVLDEVDSNNPPRDQKIVPPQRGRYFLHFPII